MICPFIKFSILTLIGLVFLSCERKDIRNKSGKEPPVKEVVTTDDIAKYYDLVSDIWDKSFRQILAKDEHIIIKGNPDTHMLRLNWESDSKKFYVRYAVGGVIAGPNGIVDGYLNVYKKGDDVYEVRFVVGRKEHGFMRVTMELDKIVAANNNERAILFLCQSSTSFL